MGLGGFSLTVAPLLTVLCCTFLPVMQVAAGQHRHTQATVIACLHSDRCPASHLSLSCVEENCDLLQQHVYLVFYAALNFLLLLDLLHNGIICLVKAMLHSARKSFSHLDSLSHAHPASM
jgi:hypothetical protein